MLAKRGALERIRLTCFPLFSLLLPTTNHFQFYSVSPSILSADFSRLGQQVRKE